MCHPPWIKLDWNHHQSKNKELNCTQSSRQRPTCTWVAFYSSGNININLLSLSLLIVAFLRPIRDTHCVSQSRTRGGMKTWNITSVWRRAGDLESESDDLISIFHEMSSRPGGRMSSYGTSWYRDFSCILQDFLRRITQPFLSPQITLIPATRLPMVFYSVSFKTSCWRIFVGIICATGDWWPVPGACSLSQLWRPLVPVHGLYHTPPPGTGCTVQYTVLCSLLFTRQ